MLRYAITDRTLYGATEHGAAEPARREALLAQAARLAAEGIDFIQLREKDLGARDLIGIARGLINIIRQTGSVTRLLVNSRADVAVAAGADGVHLPAGDASMQDQLTPAQVRQLFAASRAKMPIVSVSCHTFAEVERARDNAADLVLFGPLFGKTLAGQIVVPGTGLEALSTACKLAREIPVLALGGVTAANTPACLAAGARGIAAIRLFR